MKWGQPMSAIFAAMQMRPTVYMLLAGLAFSTMYVLAKQLSHLGGFAVTGFRGLGTFVPTLGYLLYKGIPLRGNRPKLLFLRAMTGSTSLVLFFVAIETLPITAAVAMRYLSPIFAVAFVAYLLKERVKRKQWLLFLLAFAGVVMVKGFDPRIATFGLLLVLASAVLDGATFTIIKKIGKSEHTMVLVAWFTGFATLVGFGGWALTFGNSAMPTEADWPKLASIGLVGLVGQYFMTTAMQTGRSSQVMPLKYVEAVFMLVLGSYFLGETYGWLTLVGIGCIVVANVGNLLVRHADV